MLTGRRQGASGPQCTRQLTVLLPLQIGAHLARHLLPPRLPDAPQRVIAGLARVDAREEVGAEDGPRRVDVAFELEAHQPDQSLVHVAHPLDLGPLAAALPCARRRVGDAAAGRAAATGRSAAAAGRAAAVAAFGLRGSPPRRRPLEMVGGERRDGRAHLEIDPLDEVVDDPPLGRLAVAGAQRGLREEPLRELLAQPSDEQRGEAPVVHVLGAQRGEVARAQVRVPG